MLRVVSQTFKLEKIKEPSTSAYFFISFSNSQVQTATDSTLTFQSQNKAPRIPFIASCLCHRRTRPHFFLQALHTLGAAGRARENQRKYNRGARHGALHCHSRYWV